MINWTDLYMSGRLQPQVFTGRIAFNQDEVGDTKLNEDRYEVYVNDEFIGHKTLLNASDDLKDVDDFLKRQGIEYFTTELVGDHYNISTGKGNEGITKEAIKVYFNNR